MKTLIAALVAFAPFAASAKTMGIMPMASVRTQIRQEAKQNGFFTKGSGESLRIKTLSKPSNGKPGQVAVTIMGRGGFTGAESRVRLATGTFKVQQVSEGQIAKQKGAWQHIYYLAGK